MASSQPISARKRKRIVELAADGMSRNQIARELGVSASTVSRTVKAAGGQFDRTGTANATEARRVDMAAKRAEIAEGLLEDAAKLRSQMFAPTVAFNFGGKDNTYNETQLDEPTFADKLKIAQAAATVLGRHIDLVKHDADQGADAAKSMLAELGRALGIGASE